MQFEYDPEKLIEEVKIRPGLWDLDHPDHKRQKMNKLWNEVVKELLTIDASVTKSEMRELEVQLQKKWKSIRDSFFKYIQNPRRTKRPYIYYNNLVFLLKYDQLDNKKADTESEEDREPKKNRNDLWVSTAKKIKVSKDTSSDSSSDVESVEFVEDNNYERDVKPEIPKRKTEKGPDFAFANVEDQGESEDEADKLFLLSLQPHLKTIPKQFKLSVKMELLQVLQNACNKYSVTAADVK